VVVLRVSRAAILITAVGFNLFGDGIRDLLDPKSGGNSDERIVLSIDDLHLSFPVFRGEVHALNHVSLEIKRGEIVGVVGESGSGKSVTAMLAMRLLPEGAITFITGR
jgi:ABC-type multidrug transport system fused ATPase/permease subunit